MRNMLKVAIVPFIQDVCRDGYHQMRVAPAEANKLRLAPKNKIGYLKSIEKIEINDPLMVINFLLMKIEQGSQGFIERFGMLIPEIRYPSENEPWLPKDEKRATFPIECDSEFLNWKVRHYITDFLKGGHVPAQELHTHCRFKSYVEQLEIEAVNLFGFLLLYLASARSSGISFKQCEQCDDWFEIRDLRARNARFCSVGCRVKGHRSL